MRKYIIGALFGIALTIASSAFADDIISLIGLKIQGTYKVMLDGTKLDNDAIVVNGSSYLPVRSFAEIVGYNVYFHKESGIDLQKKEVIPVSTRKRVLSKETQLKMLDDQIKQTNGRIKFYGRTIGDEQQRGGQNVDGIKKWTTELEIYKVQLADLEKQKAELTATN